MSHLRTFHSLGPSQLRLESLQSTFSESYNLAMQKFGNRPFLTLYRRNGSKLERNFAEFDQDVKRVSQLIRDSYPDASTIATCEGNTYEHVVYIAAILWSGYQFCPLNPNDSIEQKKKKIQALPEDCQVLDRLTIPQNPVSQVLPPKNRPAAGPFINVFTSGSTGHSKLVQQTELGVLSNVEALLRHHHLTTGNSVLATPLPLFHVNALEFSFLCCLLGGQELVLFETFDLLQVLRVFQEKTIHIFSAVPHLIFLIGRQMSKFLKGDLKNFRYFVSAAGPLPCSTLNSFAQNGIKIIQGYGLSEAVNFSLKTPVDWPLEKIRKIAMDMERPSVGVPLWGNEVDVLREDLSACKENEVGEICIRGIGVMLGYRNDGSSEVFRGDYLHTGDLGFWKFDGSHQERIYFITGRFKDIAKKYGATVSLVELDETVLRCLPAGLDAISVNFENLAAGEEIGLILGGPSPDFDVSTFVGSLFPGLPRDMRPRVIALTDRPIRTESGKPLRWTFRQVLKDFLDSQQKMEEYHILDLRTGKV